MKQCPTCNLVETDDALRFCRADRTTLMSYSGPVGAEAGTTRFDQERWLAAVGIKMACCERPFNERQFTSWEGRLAPASTFHWLNLECPES